MRARPSSTWRYSPTAARARNTLKAHTRAGIGTLARAARNATPRGRFGSSGASGKTRSRSRTVVLRSGWLMGRASSFPHRMFYRSKGTKRSIHSYYRAAGTRPGVLGERRFPRCPVSCARARATRRGRAGGSAGGPPRGDPLVRSALRHPPRARESTVSDPRPRTIVEKIWDDHVVVDQADAPVRPRRRPAPRPRGDEPPGVHRPAPARPHAFAARARRSRRPTTRSRPIRATCRSSTRWPRPRSTS